MMFFQDGEFPQCGRAYRAVIGSIMPGTKVYKAMATCIESEALTKQALAPGTYPRLNIAKLTHNGNWVRNVGGTYDGCDPASVNYIWVNWNIARDMENRPNYYNAHIFTRTFLHEAVHWGRHTNKLPGTIDGKEAGSWFAHLAFDIPYAHHWTEECSE